jgi:uncharacterized damage-inducible protein DinB
MTASVAQLHFRYTHWASRRLLDAIANLSPEDLERPNGISHGSILGTLAHVQWADWIWYTRVVGPMEKPGGTLAALQTEWPELQRRWEAWADSASDADLQRDLTYKLMNGTEITSPIWQIVLHVVNHGTLHRGQVAGMLRQLNIAPPNTDMIGYYRTLPSMSKASA